MSCCAGEKVVQKKLSANSVVNPDSWWCG